MKKTRRLAFQIDASAAFLTRLSNGFSTRLMMSPPLRGVWAGAGGPLNLFYPATLLPGDAVRGELWLAGDYTLPGALIRGADADSGPFAVTPPNARWQASLHGFDFLIDLLAVQGESGRQAARQAMLDWVRGPYLTRAPVMAPAIVGRRLSRWLMALSVLQDGFDSHDMMRLQNSFAAQSRWLSRHWQKADDGLARLTAICGLALAGLAVNDDGRILRRGMDGLMRELRRQILPDGGHLSRAPSVLIHILADLIAIEGGLAARQIAPPAQFSETIKRMQSMLALMRLTNGELAVFHGGLSATKPAIDAVLPRRKAADKMSFAQKSGYQRLEVGQSCLLIDTGDPPSGHASRTAHAAPLAFEMSYAGDKFITNCGPNLVHGEDWQLAARGLPAHTTLAFERDVIDPFLRHGFAARQLGARLKPLEWLVHNRRVEDKTGIWLEMSHAGFVASHGVRHNRRFFIDALGEDIRGEDLLLADMNHVAREGARFHLRFHLHPDIRASGQSGGNNVLLVGRSGHGFQFRMAGPAESTQLQIEESVYMGRDGIPQRAQQLAIYGVLGHTDTLIQWALRYAGKSQKPRA